jgi:double-stranded uracil-DNA glycosylase
MTRARPRGPSRDELVAAADRRVDPVVAADLRVLFCGINPGLWTAWAGHHFARPGNRFWPTLHRSGFTPRRFDPAEQAQLLDLGLGITNVVDRATATAAELSRAELAAGGRHLTEFVRQWRPAYLAVLGVTAYRSAFAEPKATVGPQSRAIGGTAVWVLPNPSGLNAHWTPTGLAQVFAGFRDEVERTTERHRRPGRRR